MCVVLEQMKLWCHFSSEIFIFWLFPLQKSLMNVKKKGDQRLNNFFSDVLMFFAAMKSILISVWKARLCVALFVRSTKHVGRIGLRCSNKTASPSKPPSVRMRHQFGSFIVCSLWDIGRINRDGSVIKISKSGWDSDTRYWLLCPFLE